MKVICTHSESSSLTDAHFRAGYTPDSTYHTKIGTEYIVYAVCFFKSFLMYLIFDETNSPEWYPAALFKIEDDNVPKHWCFAEYSDKRDYDLQAIWGYPEIVRSESHFDQLSQHDPLALQIFEKAKAQIDADSRS